MARLSTLKPRVGASLVSRVSKSPVARIRGRAWMATRAEVLSAAPLCPMCQAEGAVRAAEEVDHRIPLHRGGTNDRSNLVGLCRVHHAEKTAAEAAERRMDDARV